MTTDIAPGIGIVAIDSLDKSIASKFKDLVAKLKENDVLVLDFRFTRYGDIAGGQTMLSELLPKDTPLFVEKDSVSEKKYYSQSTNTAKKIIGKIVVLQSKDAGGISEAVTHVLKKHFKTLVIGEASSGIMHVKALVTVENSFSLLIPTREIRGSDGTIWNGKPITPDIFSPNIMNFDLTLVKELLKI